MSSTITPTTSSTSTSTTTPTASSLITSTGIGSGLDITSIVSSLTTAFGFAQNTQLANQTTSLDSQVSAYGTFAAALDTLKASLPALETPSKLAGFVGSVTDPTIASATTSSGAVAGQYSLQVTNLATVATLTSAPIGATTTVGSGTLNIQVGNAATSINIDSSNDTLAGIAAAINSATNNPGVTASVITTSDGSRLVVTGTATGASNTIAVTQSGGDGGLAALNLTQTAAPTDAHFSINGYAATSASNQVTGAITGVTINLLAASAASTPTTLTISPDTSAASDAVGKFVTALNGVLTSIQSLTAYDPSTQVAGPLNGNATLEAFQNQLQQILGSVTHGGVAGAKSLADIGITASTDGTYASDPTKLSNALTSSLASVASLLGGSNGIASQIDNLVNGYTKAGGLLDTINQGLESSLSDVQDQQTRLNAQLATYSATLTAQYNAMDKAVALLKQTQQYLTAEFDPSSSSSSSSSNSSLGSGNLNT